MSRWLSALDVPAKQALPPTPPSTTDCNPSSTTPKSDPSYWSPSEFAFHAATHGRSRCARVVGFRFLTPARADPAASPALKPAFELELEVGERNEEVDVSEIGRERELVHFRPGDALGVLAPNSVADVAAVLERLELNGSELVEMTATGHVRLVGDSSSKTHDASSEAEAELSVRSAPATPLSSSRRRRGGVEPKDPTSPVSTETETANVSVASTHFPTSVVSTTHGPSAQQTGETEPVPAKKGGARAAFLRGRQKKREASTNVEAETDSAVPGRHLPRAGEYLTAVDLIRWWPELRAAPKKRMLKSLARCCSDEKDRVELESWADPRNETGSAQYRKLCVIGGWPSLPDLLLRFTSCKPSLDDICKWYPALPPRYYSISSRCSCSVDVRHCRTTLVLNENHYVSRWTIAARTGQLADNIDVSLHANDTLPCARHGLASSYLLDMGSRWLADSTGQISESGSPRDELRVFLKHRAAPHMFTYPPLSTDVPEPLKVLRPVVAIGAGTGVAPFKGIFEEMAGLASTATPEVRQRLGTGVLFAGCRYECDTLYQSEFSSLSLNLGWQYAPVRSRTGPSQGYVQDRMKSAEFAPLLKELLSLSFRCAESGLTPSSFGADPSAPVFMLCGDAKGLLLGVSAALEVLLEGESQVAPGAESRLSVLTSKGWFLADIW